MRLLEGKRVAFTLAEVLITLGIIGIIAAMTLPTLIQKHQRMVLKNQFKKVYNTFSNALVKTYMDNGNNYFECYYYDIINGHVKNSECTQFGESLKKTLNVVKVCESNAVANGCVPPEMKGADTVKKENAPDTPPEDVDNFMSTYCDGFNETKIKNNNEAWVLADGTTVGYYSTRSIFGTIFWLDVNGLKKPNKWGYDIFQFRYFSDGGANTQVILQPVVGNCAPIEKGGVDTQTMINSLYK